MEVESVETDMNANTVSVVFDDASISIEDVVSALAAAGYVFRNIALSTDLAM